MGKVFKIIIGIGLIIVSIYYPGLTGFTAQYLFAAGAGLALSGVADFVRKHDIAELAGSRLRLGFSSTGSRRLLVGEVRSSGQVVFVDTTGAGNDIFWMVVAVAAHEVDSFGDFYLDDELVTFSGDDATGDFTGVFSRYTHTGADAQAADTALVAASNFWTTDHKLSGVAYFVAKFIHDQDKFPSGLMIPSVVTKGAKVYDPRLDSTVQGGSGSHRSDDETTWAWSDNPALIWMWYRMLAADKGGCGVPVARLDFASVIAAANICEEPVTLKAGGTVERYTCNTTLDTARKRGDNVDAILTSMAGWQIYSSGTWSVFAGASAASSLTLGEGDLRGPVSMVANTSRRERVNGVRGLFIDPNKSWQSRDLPTRQDAAALADHNGEEMWADVELPATTNGPTGQRLMQIKLNFAKGGRTINYPANLKAMQVRAGDIVTLDLPRWSISGDTYRVIKWVMVPTGDEGGNVGLGIDLVLREELGTEYDWDETTDEVTETTADPLALPFGFPFNTQLGPAATQDQGNGTLRTVAHGVQSGTARDGDAFTFNPAWQSIPEIIFLSGGVSHDPVALAAAAEHAQDFQPIDVSTSGFTASLKIKELSAAPTNETDGDGTGAEVAWHSGNSPGPNWQGGKENATEAWNDTYTYTWDWTAFAASFMGYDITGAITVGLYTNDGGGWVLRATKALNAVGSNITINGDSQSIIVDGLTSNAGGEEYGMDVESTSGLGGTLNDVVSVTWANVAIPTGQTATPVGASNVPFLVVGNAQSGV